MIDSIMMMLGPVVFSVNTTTYQQINRDINYKWISQDRIGSYPAYQYTGRGVTRMSITGTVYPGQYGSRAQLRVLEESAGLGVPLTMFAGSLSLGAWCITQFSETERQLFSNGQPQKIEFTVILELYAGLTDYLLENQNNLIDTVSGFFS